MPRDEDLGVAQVFRLLGVHSFVFFLLVLALLNIAIFMVPGLSIVFGVPMVILAVQMLLGLAAPIFPNFIYGKRIKASLFHRGLDLAVLALEKIEPAIRPRLLFLTSSWTKKLHSLAALVLAFLVAIPVPLLNLPPSVGLILLCIGLMQRDGLFILGAYMFAGWSLWLYESLGQAAQGLF